MNKLMVNSISAAQHQLIALLLIFAGTGSQAQTNNVLSGKFAAAQLEKILIPATKWVPFPVIADRAGWAKADQEMLGAYIKQAERYLSYNWPAIPATKSLLIARTGDRDEYQTVSFEKRRVLGTLLLAEIAENKGRFTDQIINGVWSVCEESSWVVPAHLPQSREYSGLMDVSKPFVDLFAAETATYLAWVDYFMAERLDSLSPQIRKRIYFETNNRIFEPLMNRPHGFMQAGTNGRPPNNWNPWICSNWLNAILLLEKDEKKRIAAVAKILHVLDQFMNPYPADGGCDEGPGYWGAAAASLFDNVAMLNLASNNAFEYVYQNEKFKNMGRFIYRAQIGPSYFINFADADPKPGMAASMIYRYGKAIADEDMMKFGAYYRKPETGKVDNFQFFRIFFSLFMQDDFKKAAKGLPLPADVWLPDLQVMFARDKAGTEKGWYVAAKGGHNDESHNHNDIGNYVVYYDGQPLIIDVGRGTYTRKTFSGKRYDIWYNCSDYHNVPTLNGATQPPGREFKATGASFTPGRSSVQFSLDMATAYPDSAGVKSWKRSIRFNRGKNVLVDDRFALSKAASIVQHIMTCYPAEITEPGKLLIRYKPADGWPRDFAIRYDAKQLEAAVEKVKLESMEDEGIRQKWGDNIYRINFTLLKPASSGNINFNITAE